MGSKGLACDRKGDALLAAIASSTNHANALQVRTLLTNALYHARSSKVNHGDAPDWRRIPELLAQVETLKREGPHGAGNAGHVH